MPALHESPRGAIAPTLLPFPRTESRDDTDLPEYTKLLGKIYDMHDGVCATLVRATAPILAAASLLGSRALKATSAALRTVEVTAGGGGEVICGFTFPGLKDVAAGELFWLLIPEAGKGRVTVIADGAGISGAGVFLQGGAAGSVTEVAQSTVPGETPLKATAAAGAGLASDVLASANTVF